MDAPTHCRALVLTFGAPHTEPWWWRHIEPERTGATLEYKRLSLGNKRADQVSTIELVRIALRVAGLLWRERGRFDYVFTFECDVTSFAVALWQTLLFQRRPRHVILQFIMREKLLTLISRLKYGVLKLCFTSVHRVICSSRAEGDYYRTAFGWPDDKVAFVPFHTDPDLLNPPADDDDFIIAAGRSFRDYRTLAEAVAPLAVRVLIVASPASCRGISLPPNVELRYDLPPQELNRLIRRSRVLVLPLADRRISIGQSVLLQGMAQGKAVVATRTAGTEDYIRDGDTGLLVPPTDPAALRRALESLITDASLRRRLGDAAYTAVRAHHLPQHYVLGVARALKPADAFAPSR